MVVEIPILCINICSVKQLHTLNEGPQPFNIVRNISVIYTGGKYINLGKNNLKMSLHRDTTNNYTDNCIKNDYYILLLYTCSQGQSDLY